MVKRFAQFTFDNGLIYIADIETETEADEDAFLQAAWSISNTVIVFVYEDPENLEETDADYDATKLLLTTAIPCSRLTEITLMHYTSGTENMEQHVKSVRFR